MVITAQGGRLLLEEGLPCSPGGGGWCSVGALASIQQQESILSGVTNQEIFDAVKCTWRGHYPKVETPWKQNNVEG